jgi:hypothetical protein
MNTVVNPVLKADTHHRLAASFACLAVFLAGCQNDVNEIVEDSVTFDGHVVDDAGGFMPVHAERIRDRVDFWWDTPDTDVNFPILRSGELPVHVTLSGVLPYGAHDGTEVPIRLCVCHVREARPDDDFYCDDDEVRTCADVVTIVRGERADTECRGSMNACMEEFDLTLEIPEGGEFFGTVRVVHDEAWTSGWI